jgi:hypothetical protein
MVMAERETSGNLASNFERMYRSVVLSFPPERAMEILSSLVKSL